MKTNTITAGAVLRLTQESDVALLPAIERSAAQAFRQIPSLAWLADSEVISVARHHDYLETEHSLLAVAAGQPVGFILTEPLDDALFIVEVAVHQAWQQQGIGWMLLERVIESARQMGYPAVTLTTFREARADPRLAVAARGWKAWGDGSGAGTRARSAQSPRQVSSADSRSVGASGSPPPNR